LQKNIELFSGIVHRADVLKVKKKFKNKRRVQDSFINKTIIPELKTLIGERDGCNMWQ
jgi:hypothetical protein